MTELSKDSEKTLKAHLISYEGTTKPVGWQKLKFLLPLTVAAACGFIFSSGGLLASLVFPVLVAHQPTRLYASLTALVYYLAAGRDILEVGEFLSRAGSSMPAAVLWALVALAQASIWGAVAGLPCRTTIASVATAAIPLAVLSWGHPWHAAGLLFPGAGIFGLVLLALILEASAIEPWFLLSLPVAATAVGVWQPTARPPIGELLPIRTHIVHSPPRNWAAVNTAYGDVYHHPDHLGIIEHLTRVSNQHSARVVVWPESIVPSYNEATAGFWPPIAPDKTVVFGGTLNMTTAGGYRNVVLFRGREAPSPVDQRIPVPFAMWKPWSSDGVSLSFRSAVRTIAGERAAFLVCYEQLLVWPYLTLFTERPTLFVGLSNIHWVRGTSIPTVQTACLRSWASLFRLPYLQAVNQ
jgi:hypothetical protein